MRKTFHQPKSNHKKFNEIMIKNDSESMPPPVVNYKAFMIDISEDINIIIKTIWNGETVTFDSM